MHAACRRSLAVALVAASSACGASQAQRAYDIDVTGCGTARVLRTVSQASTDLDAVVSGCYVVADPVGRVARAVWLSHSGDVDSMRIRTSGPASSPTVLTRADLTTRYGAVDRTRGTATLLLWPMVLLAPLVAAVAMILVARQLLRAGVIVVLTRR